VFVELESSFVDDYLMVKPAEGNKVLGVGASAFRPWGFVVDFDPVGGVASVYGTVPSGFGQLSPAERWRRDSLGSAVDHWCAVFGVDGDFGDTVTEDRF
jgi:hypothetical protein